MNEKVLKVSFNILGLVYNLVDDPDDDSDYESDYGSSNEDAEEILKGLQNNHSPNVKNNTNIISEIKNHN